jgi:hypothetical protein
MIATVSRFDEKHGCPIHGHQIHAGDGGTGCWCPEHAENMVNFTEIHDIDKVQKVKKVELEFCKRCGKHHPASWCPS